MNLRVLSGIWLSQDDKYIEQGLSHSYQSKTDPALYEGNGIHGFCPGPNLSKRIHGKNLYPYLLRNLKIDHPNQVWSIDVTYCRMKRGFMYMVAIIDWYSRILLV